MPAYHDPADLVPCHDAEGRMVRAESGGIRLKLGPERHRIKRVPETRAGGGGTVGRGEAEPALPPIHLSATASAMLSRRGEARFPRHRSWGFTLGLLSAALLVAGLSGCTSEPAASPAVQQTSTPSEPVGVAASASVHEEASPRALEPPPEGLAVPDGMVYVPGGTTRVGSEDGLPSERPVFATRVEPFFLDKHPVTVAEFKAFVEATGYETEAERFGDAGVLGPGGQWALVQGANWRYPLGPEGPPAPLDHPVTQVSWNDAAAYAAWAGRRLPTEVEWEHAARGAVDARAPYAWGQRLADGDAYHANTWQGPFPARNDVVDGHRYTSPVGAFGETPLGLTDMGGNVWEWTADWFRPYSERDRPFTPTAASEKAQRGGSFLCNASWCHGFRVSGRSHSTPETALFHVGFRTAKDVGEAEG